MDWAFVDKLAGQNNRFKCLLVALDIFLRFVGVQTMRTKFAKDTLQVFKKWILKKTLLNFFGLLKKQNMREFSKNFARWKILMFNQQWVKQKLHLLEKPFSV